MDTLAVITVVPLEVDSRISISETEGGRPAATRVATARVATRAATAGAATRAATAGVATAGVATAGVATAGAATAGVATAGAATVGVATAGAVTVERMDEVPAGRFPRLKLRERGSIFFHKSR